MFAFCQIFITVSLRIPYQFTVNPYFFNLNLWKSVCITGKRIGIQQDKVCLFPRSQRAKHIIQTILPCRINGNRF